MRLRVKRNGAEPATAIATSLTGKEDGGPRLKVLDMTAAMSGTSVQQARTHSAFFLGHCFVLWQE
jgi:hypothetical protein